MSRNYVNSSAPFKVGLVGCGHIGRVVHLSSLQRLPDTTVTALADADPDRLGAAHAQSPGAVTFTDYRQLLDQAETDAVVICLPNCLHAEAARLAFERNKHVYLEKPLAVSLEEGNSVIDVWRRSDRVGMIGFNYRSNPLHCEMRRRIETGEIGRLVGARSVWTTAPHGMPEWKTSRRTGGGVLLDLASHHFDLFRFWFNQDIAEVHATVRSERAEDDTATVQLRLANGMLIESFFSLSSIPDERFEVYGSTGKLWFDRFNSWNVELTDSQRRSIPSRYLRRAISSLPQSRFALNKLRSPGLEPSFSEALAQFVAAARSGRPAHPDLNDGFKSLAVVMAAEESARAGRPVKLSPASH